MFFIRCRVYSWAVSASFHHWLRSFNWSSILGLWYVNAFGIARGACLYHNLIEFDQHEVDYCIRILPSWVLGPKKSGCWCRIWIDMFGFCGLLILFLRSFEGGRPFSLCVWFGEHHKVPSRTANQIGVRNQRSFCQVIRIKHRHYRCIAVPYVML